MEEREGLLVAETALLVSILLLALLSQLAGVVVALMLFLGLLGLLAVVQEQNQHQP